MSHMTLTLLTICTSFPQLVMVAQKVMMNKIMTSRHYAITLNKLKMCMADKH